MRWDGALRMGMGGAVGEGLDKVPGGGGNVKRALDLAAAALVRGEAIPAEAAELFAKRLMPVWLYIAIGNMNWRLQLRRNRAKSPIAFRPYPQR
jgi:hypothetical protein